MIYLDSNAMVKLIRVEGRSEALRAWLEERADQRLVSSELALAEVVRVVRRSNHNDQGHLVDPEAMSHELALADELLDEMDLLALDFDVLRRAGTLGDPMVRTLDAIHLISALDLDTGTLEFVSYDRRLSATARAAGLTVVAPA